MLVKESLNFCICQIKANQKTFRDTKALLHSSVRASQESELRKRIIVAPEPPAEGVDQLDGSAGIQDHTSRAPTQQQHETEERQLPEAAGQPREDAPVPGNWSPLLTNVCLCTALAVSAYVCYRAYFH